VGVLPKQVEPVEVSKVLTSLRVIGSQADKRRRFDDIARGGRETDAARLEGLDQDLRELISDLFDQQRAVLRRDLLDSYETIASRVATEIRDVEEPDSLPADDPGQSVPRSWKVSAAILAVAVMIFASLFIQRVQSWRQLSAQNAELMQTLEQQQAAQVSGALQVQQQFDTYEKSIGDTYLTALDAIEWGVNQTSRYAFDEIPLGDSKLRQFENMLAILMNMKFVGQVRVEVHTGDYCMVAASADSWVPAQREMSIESCDRIGFEQAEAIERGLRQSVSFANFLNVAEERTGGRIRFDIASLGNLQPDSNYPSARTGLTAGLWNEIAARNSRVVISLFPDNL
jgi:hypothetical protein